MTSGGAWLDKPRLVSSFAYGTGKLLHTRYRVNDLEKTVEFYKTVLGLEEVRRHRPRGELAFLKAPESEETIEICHFPNSGWWRCRRI